MRQTSTSSGSASRSSGSFWQGPRSRPAARPTPSSSRTGRPGLPPWPPGRSGVGRRRSSPGRRRRGPRSARRSATAFPPAALLAQAVFWADLWVLAASSRGPTSTPYSAAARLAGLLLFLTSLNLVFSPFAADLHARGERERLGELFKRSTRWALAATLPLLIILFVAADDVLEAFSSRFDVGERASNPPRRPGRERRDRRGGLHPDHDRVHRWTWSTTRSALGLLVALAVALTAAFGMDGTAVAAAVSISPTSCAWCRSAAGSASSRTTAPISGSPSPPERPRSRRSPLHAALDARSWWVSLAVTAAGCLAAYAALLPVVLPAAERAHLTAPLGWFARARTVAGEPRGRAPFQR